MGNEKVFVENPIKKYLRMRELNGDRVFSWKIHQTSANVKGISDINAVVKGLFVAIEVKASGEHISNAQRVFGENVVNAGGVFVVCDRYESFVTWYEEFYAKPEGGCAYNLTKNLRNDICHLS